MRGYCCFCGVPLFKRFGEWIGVSPKWVQLGRLVQKWTENDADTLILKFDQNGSYICFEWSFVLKLKRWISSYIQDSPSWHFLTYVIFGHWQHHQDGRFECFKPQRILKDSNWIQNLCCFVFVTTHYVCLYQYKISSTLSRVVLKDDLITINTMGRRPNFFEFFQHGSPNQNSLEFSKRKTGSQKRHSFLQGQNFSVRSKCLFVIFHHLFENQIPTSWC